MSITRYRKVDLCLWADKKVLSLSKSPPSGQLLWICLLIGPMSEGWGVTHVGEAALAESLGWPLEDFRRCWTEVEAAGMAKADWDARLVWLPKALKYDPVPNHNAVKSLRRRLHQIPDCDLKRVVLHAIAVHLKSRPPPAAGGPSLLDTWKAEAKRLGQEDAAGGHEGGHEGGEREVINGSSPDRGGGSSKGSRSQESAAPQQLPLTVPPTVDGTVAGTTGTGTGTGTRRKITTAPTERATKVASTDQGRAFEWWRDNVWPLVSSESMPMPDKATFVKLAERCREYGLPVVVAAMRQLRHEMRAGKVRDRRALTLFVFATGAFQRYLPPAETGEPNFYSTAVDTGNDDE